MVLVAVTVFHVLVEVEVVEALVVAVLVVPARSASR
jgi:hypothetical protein